MSTMAYQITCVSINYSTVCSGEDQRKHQSSTSLAFVRGIHWWSVNFPHKRPVMRKMFPFYDVIMDDGLLRIIQSTPHCGRPRHITTTLSKNKKTFTGPTYNLLWRFSVFSNVHRSFIPNKTTLTKCCLTQLISKLIGSFEIHWVKQYMIKFKGLADISNPTVYKTEQFSTGLGHDKLFSFLTLQKICYQWDTQQTQRDKHAIITSTRLFDVIMTCLLLFLFAGVCHLVYVVVVWLVK